MIYRLTYGMLQHSEDAEEVLQDTFEYAFRRLHKYDPEKQRSKRGSIKSPSAAAATSAGANGCRPSRWIMPSPPTTTSVTGCHCTRRRCPTERRKTARLAGAGQIVAKLRETALLRYHEGLSYNEIGVILDISPKTVESRMRLAHKIKELLQGSISERN